MIDQKPVSQVSQVRSNTHCTLYRILPLIALRKIKHLASVLYKPQWGFDLTRLTQLTRGVRRVTPGAVFALVAAIALTLSACAADLTPAPTPPDPAPCPTPAPTTVIVPIPSPPPPTVHLGSACTEVAARACDGAQPAICTGQDWVFNSQRCELPDCWLPSSLALGGCVVGCWAESGTCIEAP